MCRTVRCDQVSGDSLNRPVATQDALGNTMQYGYDLSGNRAVITDANGAVTQHSYDALNRLITTTYTADGVTVSTQYDAAGNRTQMVDDIGTTTYAYDDFYRLITVTNPLSAVAGYRYDDAGNRTRLIYPDGRQVSYTYRCMCTSRGNCGRCGSHAEIRN